jgi:uncharacterized phage protein gp47/JayE
MTAPVDREFELLPRGYARDRLIMANWRAGLRLQRNPETGELFTEDEIQRATQTGSRWWIEANGIDLLGQGDQRRAAFLSDQARIERANTAWLEGYHGRLWGIERLPATGGSGTVSVPAVAGTIVVGSSTIPDPAAYQARDGAGNKYQVFSTVTTPAGGTATVTMRAINTGSATNLEVGDKLTWVTRDPNMAPVATVAANFSGGTSEETDAEYARRIADAPKKKQAAGNDAHFRAWARSASNAIEDAFIYPCALHAGTTVVALTQKRSGAIGPEARVPSTSTMLAGIAYLTPPASVVVPARVWVVTVPVVPEPVDFAVQLGLAVGSDAGYADATPWPTFDATLPHVSGVTSSTEFEITCPGDATLPGVPAMSTLTGDDCPSLMFWRSDRSEFVELELASITQTGATTYDVVLASAPEFDAAVNDTVSPLVARHAIVSATVQEYFDELGPGDLFDVSTDPRGARCRRFPDTLDAYPMRAGGVLAVRIMEALGASASDAVVPTGFPTTSVPTYPTNIASGPNFLTINSVGVYQL